MDNKPYFIALNTIPGIGPRAIEQLFVKWPHLADGFRASHTALCQAGLTSKQALAIQQFDWQAIEADLRFEQTPGHTILTWEDPRYPRLLKEISSPPPVLYAAGHLACLEAPTLAMVGSRLSSPFGRESAYQWAKTLSTTPLTIVSGLARGIDSAAHQGCLASDGCTIAVLGSGINRLSSATNRDLAKKIVDKGLILSEFPLNMPASAGHFPRRNRIISGLSLATLVVEATLKSGSLITARFALEQNRDVLALPGSIHLPQAQGCHHLIKQGATLVTSCQEVLETLGLQDGTNARARVECHLPSDRVLECIGVEPTAIDTILQRSGLAIAHVLGHLTQLELHGAIRATLNGYVREAV